MSFSVRLFRTLAKFAPSEVWVEKATNSSDLKSLLSKLKPRCSAHPLIRVGGSNDGGYLIPNDFSGITSSISPGIAREVSFDLDLAKRGIDIYMFDASVDGPPIENPRFRFQKKFLEVFEDDTNVRLETALKSLPPKSGDAILQMDIEGAEWRVLMDTSSAALQRFRYMAIEFHALNHLFNRSFFRLANPLFKKLLQTHSIVHLHPNNCLPVERRGDISIPPVIEFTFMRNDMRFYDDVEVRLPNTLDADCLPSQGKVLLPNNWW
jgi:hypothetical protein